MTLDHDGHRGLDPTARHEDEDTPMARRADETGNNTPEPRSDAPTVDSRAHDPAPPPVERERRVVTTEKDHSEPSHGKHKTSAAAVFALIFGFSALLCAVAIVLSPVAILFGALALVLGVIGISKAGLPGVTGKGVAIGGLVLGLIGLLLGVAVVVGAASFLSNEANLDRIESQLDRVRDNIPTELPSELPT